MAENGTAETAPTKAPAKARKPRVRKAKELTKNRLGSVVNDRLVANYNDQATHAENRGDTAAVKYWKDLTKAVK